MKRYDRLAFALTLAPLMLTAMIARRLFQDTRALIRRQPPVTHHARWPLIAVLVGGGTLGMTMVTHLPWFTPLVAWGLGILLLATAKVISQRQSFLEPSTQTPPHGFWTQLCTTLNDVLHAVALLPKTLTHAAAATTAAALAQQAGRASQGNCSDLTSNPHAEEPETLTL